MSRLRLAGLVALAVCALGATACGRGPSAEAAGNRHLDELPVLALEEELRIGSLDDPELGFSRIGSVRPAPDGGVWVAESTDREIRSYDAAGELLATYGRQGDGPGEFRSISNFGVAGDTLWVADGSLRRLTLFSIADGQVLTTVTARIDVQIGDRSAMGGPATMPINATSYPFELRPGGVIVGYVGAATYPNLPDSVVDLPRLVFDWHGNVIDTLEMVPERVSLPAMELHLGSGIGFVYLSPPPQDSGTLRTEIEDGALDAHWTVGGSPPSGTLSILRISAAGDTTARNDFAYEPRPVPPHYVDSLATERSKGRGLAVSDSMELFRAYRLTMEMPTHFQPIVTPRRGEEGDAWLRLWEPRTDSNRHLVVGSDGDVRGIVELSSGAIVHWAGRDHVWVVERDDFEVQWLVRYRLRPVGSPTW